MEAPPVPTTSEETSQPAGDGPPGLGQRGQPQLAASKDLKFLAAQDEWLEDPRNGKRLFELTGGREFCGEELREGMLTACSRITYRSGRRESDAEHFSPGGILLSANLGVTLPNEYLGFLLINLSHRLREGQALDA